MTLTRIKHRFFLMIVIQLSFLGPMQALSNYEIGDKLSVLSEKGLNLRESSSPDGKKLTLVPYGASITVVGLHPDATFTTEGISGRWVEILYKSYKGFVFDGYLSAFAAPQKGCRSFKEYLSKAVGPGKKETVAAGDYEGQSAIRYGKNILYMGEGGDTFALYFPGISIEELFLIGKLCREVRAKKLALEGSGEFSEGFGNLENRMYLDENGVVIFRRTL
ncbi:SH3 domain-containing protein [Leptospira ognonensis]|uniref:SH3 domain-containing protein n=1 Tax=Leptospira ognonensis TaxID=2484945 RepID=A0A4R9JY53_9LEPT|nr:SH3 domain-containing protein [Leptospira ognonensis]